MHKAARNWRSKGGNPSLIRKQDLTLNYKEKTMTNDYINCDGNYMFEYSTEFGGHIEINEPPYVLVDYDRATWGDIESVTVEESPTAGEHYSIYL